MSQSSDADFPGKPQLDYDAWRDSLKKECARHNVKGIEANAFKGWMRPFDVCGFKAMDSRWNAGRIERDYRDARLHTFRQKIPPSFRSPSGRAFGEEWSKQERNAALGC